MAHALEKLVRAETGEAGFSRLEATLATNTEVVPRPNSRQMNDVHRHATEGDFQLQNELDFDYSLDTSHYPIGNLRSLQQIFEAVQCEKHLSNHLNFFSQTEIECLDVTPAGGGWRTLDDSAMDELARRLSDPREQRPRSSFPFPPVEHLPRDGTAGRFLLFLVPLTPTKETSYGSHVHMSQSNVKMFCEALNIHPLFLLNMLGRPDYWAPQAHWDSDDDGNLQAFHFSCQHPRWNLQVQGAPLSVYMRHDIVSNQTFYIISHKQKDSNVNALKEIINIGLRTSSDEIRPNLFLDDPFDIMSSSQPSHLRPRNTTSSDFNALYGHKSTKSMINLLVCKRAIVPSLGNSPSNCRSFRRTQIHTLVMRMSASSQQQKSVMHIIACTLH